jgi:protein-L-isoaspartate(D-aspartate) O-methyltransferase
MDFAAARRAMIDCQLRPQAVTDPLVITAMAVVPREEFVPAEIRALAYIDRSLPLGNGRAMDPPVTVGRMLTELQARPGERVLVVGAETGYTAAVLAEMGLDVTALESDPALLAQLAAIPAGHLLVRAWGSAPGHRPALHSRFRHQIHRRCRGGLAARLRPPEGLHILGVSFT